MTQMMKRRRSRNTQSPTMTRANTVSELGPVSSSPLLAPSDTLASCSMVSALLVMSPTSRKFLKTQTFLSKLKLPPPNRLLFENNPIFMFAKLNARISKV